MLNSIKYRTLMGSNNLEFSLSCLKSFIDHSDTIIQLEIFQDGTLNKSHEEQIKQLIPNSIIIQKSEREEIAMEKLTKYPACQKWRLNNFYSAKFFDTMLYNDHNYLFVDSDVIFLRKYGFPEFGNKPAFMEDSYTTYSFSPIDFLKIKEPVFRSINAGLMYFPKALFDLDFIEKLLSDPFLISCFYGKWCGVAEQTLWAFLAGREKSIYFFKPQEVVMATEKIKPDPETVAVHLTRPYRHKFNFVKESAKNLSYGNDTKKLSLIEKTKYMQPFEFAFEWTLSKVESKFKKLKSI